MTIPKITDELLAEIEAEAIARINLKPGQCEGGSWLRGDICAKCGNGPQDRCGDPLPQRYADNFFAMGIIAELRTLRAELESRRRDAGRLDWLDMECEGYGFEGVHEGNRWVVEGAYATVRQAIDAEMAAMQEQAK